MRAAHLGAFIPLHAQPLEIGDEIDQGLGVVAGLIGVLDAEQEIAADVPGEEPVEQRGAGPADMQITGGTGGEADAGAGGGHGSSGVGVNRLCRSPEKGGFEPPVGVTLQ